jgi:hypothetical protein
MTKDEPSELVALDMADERWFRLAVYNANAIYCWGTYDNAERFCDHLNQDREFNLYAPHIVSEEKLKELEENSEAINLDDELAAIAGIR